MQEVFDFSDTCYFAFTLQKSLILHQFVEIMMLNKMWKYPTFISHRPFCLWSQKSLWKKIPLALWQRETLASWPWSLDGHAYVRELLCCFETLIYTRTWSKHGWPVRSRLKAQTADQIQKWNQSAEAGSPDHKGNQCVRSAGRVLWQQFSQDTCFNKTWINTMDVLHTSWVSFLIKFTDQPVIVSRPAGVIQCTV